jgi:hypothetical protein
MLLDRGLCRLGQQMGRFETNGSPGPRTSLNLPGRWIGSMHQRRSPKAIVLDTDSSESPTGSE